MDGKIRCTNCARLNDGDDLFCTFCGERLDKPTPDVSNAIETPKVPIVSAAPVAPETPVVPDTPVAPAVNTIEPEHSTPNKKSNAFLQIAIVLSLVVVAIFLYDRLIVPNRGTNTAIPVETEESAHIIGGSEVQISEVWEEVVYEEPAIPEPVFVTTAPVIPSPTIRVNPYNANSGMPELAQYLNGYSISGEPPYRNFEEDFSPRSHDYDFIKVFSDLRNDILWEIYNDTGIDEVELAVGDFYSVFINLVYRGERTSYDGLILDYSELSDRGKKTVLELGQAIFSIDALHNFGYILNDDPEITKKDVLRDIRKKLNNLD